MRQQAFNVVLSTFLALAAAKANAGEIDAKVDHLLAQMTLEEKIGQLTQYSSSGDVTGPTPEDAVRKLKTEYVKSGLIGSMLNVVGAEQTRAIQKMAVENSRLGIPVIFGYDVIHGQRTIFPLPLAEAASWDLKLIEKSARIAAKEASAQGLHWTFAPMVDISRDPRWGRVMEGAGEDPFLGARIAVARTKGFQGDDLSAPDTIAATLKHFAAYGFGEGGRDYNTAEIGTVTLFNIVLPPFKAGVEEGAARTVMNAFNTVNGIPATGDSFLQRDILKGDWGFDGFVVSDWGSGKEMIDHGFAASLRDVARLAITAGSDMDMESDAFRSHLAELVDEGEVDIALVDDAVRRILTVKYELGLFDDPYRYIDGEREAAVLGAPDHHHAALKMAERSIVLLKNENDLLPFGKDEKIALIGALADDKDTPLGSWRAGGKANSAVSITEAFADAGLDFVYAKGAAILAGRPNFLMPVKINTTDRSDFDEAIAVAQSADKVVLVLGENAFQSGEGRSRSRLDLPGVQEDLLRAVVEANPNTILVVMSGRPLVLSWADKHIPAIVLAWHLGHESGYALTNVLTGKYNPSGKLPMSFPRSVGQIPIYYNHLNTGRPGPKHDVFWSAYTDEDRSPLYPFGYGLSYTEFEYSKLSVEREQDQVVVSVQVKNIGEVAGEEVVQLYLQDRVATISRPVRELKGFKKIALGSGEKMRVEFVLTEEHLGFYDAQGRYTVEQGEFGVFVGGSSAATLEETFYW